MERTLTAMETSLLHVKNFLTFIFVASIEIFHMRASLPGYWTEIDYLKHKGRMVLLKRIDILVIYCKIVHKFWLNINQWIFHQLSVIQIHLKI